MQESNGHQAPSAAPDFNHELIHARETGDFNFVLDTARKSHKMLVDFRNAIRASSYMGSETSAIAMGLNFLENMISQAAAQLAALKQTEKETREAIKMNAEKYGPEKPEEPAGADSPKPPEPAPSDKPETQQ